MPRQRNKGGSRDPESSYRLAALPVSDGLASLDIEPTALTDYNSSGAGPAPSPSATPSSPPPATFGHNYEPSDVVETPYGNPVLGNRDWIREYWDQFDPQQIIDDALEPWMPDEGPTPPLDYDNSDGLFSPSNDVSSQYTGPMYDRGSNVFRNLDPAFANRNPQQFGPSSFIGQQFHSGFDIPRFISQYTNFPAGPIAPNDPRFNVVVGNPVGNEFLQGDQSGPSYSGSGAFAGTTDAPGGPILDPEALEDSRASIDTTQGAAANPTRVTGGGPATSGTTPQHLFGMGATTGQHYYSPNGGRTWVPVGQAPQDVRWAPNSGTGNFVADQTSRGFMGWNPADSITNAPTVGDAGKNIYRPNRSTPMGQFDPEEGVVRNSDRFFGRGPVQQPVGQQRIDNGPIFRPSGKG